MIYRFQSKAAGDVIMLGTVGDAVLMAMGMAQADKGIIEPLAMPAAITAIEAAVARDEALQSPGRAADTDVPGPDGEAQSVSLQQRAWPLVEMMRRALAAGEVIVWGV